MERMNVKEQHERYWRLIAEGSCEIVGKVSVQQCQAYRQTWATMKNLPAEPTLEDLRRVYKLFKADSDDPFEQTLCETVRSALSNLGNHMKDPANYGVRGRKKKWLQGELLGLPS